MSSSSGDTTQIYDPSCESLLSFYCFFIVIIGSRLDINES